MTRITTNTTDRMAQRFVEGVLKDDRKQAKRRERSAS